MATADRMLCEGWRLPFLRCYVDVLTKVKGQTAGRLRESVSRDSVEQNMSYIAGIDSLISLDSVRLKRCKICKQSQGAMTGISQVGLAALINIL
jgi:hypothetical protein